MNSASKFPRQGDKQNSSFFEQYLLTLESESLSTHIPRGDPDSPDMLVRELREQRIQGFFTRENVAELTHAAGVEDELLELQARA